MAEIKNGQLLTSEEWGLYMEERARLSQLTNGWGTPENLIISDNFPLTDEFSPEVFKIYQRLAKGSLEVEQRRLDIREKYPMIWGWPDQKEREFLMGCAELGLAEQAVQWITEEYKERLKKCKLLGFGVE